MTRQFKAIIKKVYKAGFYGCIIVGSDYVSFKNVHGVVFSFQLDSAARINRLGIFSAGYVTEYTERGLTFESDYKTMGDIKKAAFSPFFVQETDNPDFILRAANSITLN